MKGWKIREKKALGIIKELWNDSTMGEK